MEAQTHGMICDWYASIGTAAQSGQPYNGSRLCVYLDSGLLRLRETQNAENVAARTVFHLLIVTLTSPL